MKLVSAEFNKEAGVSTVVLQNKNGRYVGKAKLAPEDADVASEFAGCRIAEQRAWINYYKTEIRRAKIKLKAIDELWADMHVNATPWKYFDPPKLHFMDIIKIDAEYYDRVFKMRKRYEDYIKEMETCIEILQNTIKLDIKDRDKVVKLFKKNEGDT